MASSYSRHGGDYGYQEPGWQGGEPGAYGAPEPDAPYPGAPLDPAAPVPVASRLVQYAGAATSVALILGVVIWGYRLAVRDVSGVPVIRAIAGPARIAPEDPGGDLARHVGLAVNQVAGTGLAAPGPERVVLAPAPSDLAPEDLPMTGVKLDREGRAIVAKPAASVQPAALPVAEVPRVGAGAVTGKVEALPEGEVDEEGAAAPAPAPEVEAAPQAVAPPAAPAPAAEAAAPEVAPEAAPEAPALKIIPASVPGVAVSPRPLARPGKDFGTEALAAALTREIGGETAPAVREVEAASLKEGTRLVQLGAFDTPELARAEWDKAATRFEALMAGKGRVVQEASSGGRTFYRLRVEGFADVDEARRFCAALVAEGQNCIPALVR
ncbi:SPOR domain-containing protein [Rhodobacter xanthinilyticus]|uniref:SPOR domain-containing protein n=1 Tax=Rhodobacter xanthinilyticus TaxID=1850250 RepID=UPI0009ED4200|nr:SPOR domain-containing protein [Rhodobacter xanthinilyticus]